MGQEPKWGREWKGWHLESIGYLGGLVRKVAPNIFKIGTALNLALLVSGICQINIAKWRSILKDRVMSHLTCYPPNLLSITGIHCVTGNNLSKPQNHEAQWKARQVYNLHKFYKMKAKRKKRQRKTENMIWEKPRTVGKTSGAYMSVENQKEH